MKTYKTPKGIEYKIGDRYIRHDEGKAVSNYKRPRTIFGINQEQGQEIVFDILFDGDKKPMGIMYKSNLDTKLDNGDIELVKTNQMKEEIIGYKLLKDLPGISAGAIGKPINDAKVYYSFGNLGFNFSVNQELRDTTWFEPIYKKKDVTIKISVNEKGSRTIVLFEKQISISFNGDYGITNYNISYEEFEKLYQMMFPIKMIHTHVDHDFQVEFLQVKIGCQKFTNDDVKTIHKAIQDLK